MRLKKIFIMLILVFFYSTANATIASDSITLGVGGFLDPYIIKLDNITQTVIAVSNENINDIWQLKLNAPAHIDLNFATQTVSPMNIKINQFTAQYLTEKKADGFFDLDLASGVYQFTVKGIAGTGVNNIGGIYSLTTSVATVPIPPAIWLMGTGVILLFKRRVTADKFKHL